MLLARVFAIHKDIPGHSVLALTSPWVLVRLLRRGTISSVLPLPPAHSWCSALVWYPMPPFSWAGGLRGLWLQLRVHVSRSPLPFATRDSHRGRRSWVVWFQQCCASILGFLSGAKTRQSSHAASTSPSPANRSATTRLHRCQCSPQGRNLVVCIDGTSHQFGKKHSNVIRLHSQLLKDDRQLTFYSRGIGTYATPRSRWRPWEYLLKMLYSWIDLALALTFDETIIDAYRWLSENYRPGDRIFLFGFSRGGYQVRVLAGLIEEVGLLFHSAGNDDQILVAYQLYTATQKAPDVRRAREQFKRKYCREVHVHFAGLWDCVSSIGFSRVPTLPSTTTGMRFICYVRHALALNDFRVKFLPEYVHGGDGPLEDEIAAIPGQLPHTREVWFAGNHSDIGGGEPYDRQTRKSGPPLRWILFEAVAVGLRLSDAPRDWDDNAPELRSSVSLLWNILECLPLCHLSYKDEMSVVTRPHLRKPRTLKLRQGIHQTALVVGHEIFSVWAQPQDGSSWEALRAAYFNDTETQYFIESDLYTRAQRILDQIQEDLQSPSYRYLSPHHVPSLRALVSSELGVQSLRDCRSVSATLQALLDRYGSTPEAPLDDCESVIGVLLAVGIKYQAVNLHPIARRVAPSNPELATKLMEALSTPLLDHPDWVRSVAYLSRSNQIVTGSDDGVVRIWDVKKSEIVHQMFGHTDWIWSVTVSSDGTCIASGSRDKNIHIWDAETGTLACVLQGHTEDVNSVSFSPDGRRLVSGSDDCSIRIWDIASRAAAVIPIQLSHTEGRLDVVWSVAYSPDGTRIASCSDDQGVQMWDALTGQRIWRTSLSTRFFPIAFSSDGTRVATGSHEGGFVLNAETGDMILGPLTGHTEVVRSIAFSPDDRYIASGSFDDTLRMWDAETGEQLQVFRGHSNVVRCIAFSPDGECIASASSDKTVRIWDITNNWGQWMDNHE